jgi:pentatricopeptide repeat protein
MKKEGVPLTVDTYCTMISLLAKERNSKVMKTIFEEGLDIAIGPKEMLYDALIQGYVACKAIKNAKIYFKKMIESSMMPSDKTIMKYLELLAISLKEEEIDKVLKIVLEKRGKDPPSSRLSHAFMIAYGNMAKFDKMREALNKMKSFGFKPNERTYLIAMKAYGRRGRILEMRKTFNEMIAEGIDANEDHHAIIMKFEVHIIRFQFAWKYFFGLITQIES